MSYTDAMIEALRKKFEQELKRANIAEMCASAQLQANVELRHQNELLRKSEAQLSRLVADNANLIAKVAQDLKEAEFERDCLRDEVKKLREVFFQATGKHYYEGIKI